jgi:hypothetical protein
MEVIEVKCPSGAEYKLRRLNYAEKKQVLKASMRFEMAEGKKVQQSTDPFTLLEEALWRTIVGAPWLKEGQKCTKDMLENIDGEDGDVLDAKIEEINFHSKKE